MMMMQTESIGATTVHTLLSQCSKSLHHCIH
jgi:hypothetical protein